VLLATASERAAGRSYNLGNPRATVTVYDLAQRIVALTGGASRIVFERMNYPDVALRVPNITAAREDLGFEPRVDLDEGLRRTIEWYRAAAPEAHLAQVRQATQGQTAQRAHAAETAQTMEPTTLTND
jgi:nucleoside-diphosphate-sugar epimerase